jgi:hypothetical protein
MKADLLDRQPGVGKGNWSEHASQVIVMYTDDG